MTMTKCMLWMNVKWNWFKTIEIIFWTGWWWIEIFWFIGWTLCWILLWSLWPFKLHSSVLEPNFDLIEEMKNKRISKRIFVVKSQIPWWVNKKIVWRAKINKNLFFYAENLCNHKIRIKDILCLKNVIYYLS